MMGYMFAGVKNGKNHSKKSYMYINNIYTTNLL